MLLRGDGGAMEAYTTGTLPGAENVVEAKAQAPDLPSFCINAIGPELPDHIAQSKQLSGDKGGSI